MEPIEGEAQKQNGEQESDGRDAMPENASGSGALAHHDRLPYVYQIAGSFRILGEDSSRVKRFIASSTERRFGLIRLHSLRKRDDFFDISMSMPPKQDTPSLWRPLRTPIFRQLLVADVVSDVGTFMQSMGAAWLMVSLGAGPMYVALTQTASTLPF